MPSSSTSSSRAERVVARGFLIAVSAIAALLLLETGARLWLWHVADNEQFLTYASLRQIDAHPTVKPRLVPHRYLGFATTPGYESGLNRHDEHGFRGEDVERRKPADTYRIITVGGSTTYGDGVEDYRQSYPYLLQDALRAAEGVGDRVEVINAGVPGYSTLESVLNLQMRLLDFEPDLLIVYHGINDLPSRAVWPPGVYGGDRSGYLRQPRYDPHHPVLVSSTLARGVAIRLGLEPPHYLHLPTWDTAPTAYVPLLREQRKRGTYPDGIFLEVPVERMLDRNPPIYFERNLRSLASLATRHHADVLFVTFTYGLDFPGEIVIFPPFQDGIAEHNEVVRRVARTEGTLLLDLAETFPRDRHLFTDGVHFTAEGNRLLAERIAEVVGPMLGPR